MDDIQDFITDHHYNQAIRKHSVISPEDAVAQACLDSWPALPKNVQNAQTIENFQSKLTFERVYSTAVGRYFLVEKLLTKEDGIKESNLDSYGELVRLLERYHLEKQQSLSVVERVVAKIQLPLEGTRFKDHIEILQKSLDQLRDDYTSQRDAVLTKIEQEIQAAADAAEAEVPVPNVDETEEKSEEKEVVEEKQADRDEQSPKPTEEPKQEKPSSAAASIAKIRNNAIKSSAILQDSRMLSGLIEVGDGQNEHVQGLIQLETQFQERYVSFFSPLEDTVKSFYKSVFEEMKNDLASVEKFRLLEWYSQEKEVRMSDFVIFRDLGRGAFGVVSGARHRVTGQLTALKGMNRKLIKGKKALKLVKQEFEILKKLGEFPHPNCVSLSYSFMEENDIYFGLPLMTGGDLMYHIYREYKGYGIERARFFSAQVLLGMQHMHNLGIIYRDLKPENVLLDDSGNTKISDMGLAVLVKFTPFTRGSKLIRGRAGTPGYWSIEMLKGEGYAFDCDWWSWAVMLYELIVGVCPFSEHNTKMKDRNDATLNWEMQFPNIEDGPFPDDAKDLILKMLERDRFKRLGAQPDTAEQIKKHPFFAEIDWARLESGAATPPWIPPSNSINAVSQADLEVRNKEAKFKKIVLTDEDNIQGLNFKSREHLYQVETVLHLERKGKLEHLKKAQSSTCAIL